MILRVMIDTMIYDALVHNDSLRLLVRKMQDSGQIVLMSTHIQARQLAAIPPTRNVGQKSIVRTKRVGSAVFVLGRSLLNEDRLGSEEVGAAFRHLQRGKSKQTADAMIGATAFKDADILVTNDKDFARDFAAMASATKIMTDTEFQTFLEGMD